MSQAPPPDPVQPAAPAPGIETERLLAMLCYGLFILAFANGLTALIGVVLAYLRRAPAQGTIYRSHYANLITVFWVSLVVGLLGFALLLHGLFAALLFLLWPVWRWHMLAWGAPIAVATIPVVLLAGVCFAAWYLYRVLCGFMRALDEKPY